MRKKNLIVRYGVISGLISAVWFLIAMVTGYFPSTGSMGMIIGYATMLVAFSMIFIGVKNYRDKQAGGAITFGKAFLTGLLIALIASTVYVLVWEIYYFSGACGDFMNQYMSSMIEEMRQSGMSESRISAEIEEMNKFAEMYRNPLVNVLFTYLEILPLGVIVSLIAAAIFRKKPVQDVV